MKNFVKVSTFIAAAMACAVAHAADCDQNGAPPEHAGPGPKFSGTSGVLQPVGGPHVKQWSCFFPSTDRILNVAPTLRDAKGNLATYAIYDVTFNYERAGYTQIKLSWTTTARKPIPADQLTLDYKITFQSSPAAAQP